MGILVISIIAAILLAVSAGLVLSTSQRPAYEARVLPTVRLDDPGHNLVGRDWTGIGRVNETNVEVSRMNNEESKTAREMTLWR
jgi:hypothetical protein